MVQPVNVSDWKNTGPGCLWGLCSEAFLQQQWSRTGHAGSEGFNTYREIHQKATHCHRLALTFTQSHHSLCCPTRSPLICGIFTSSKIREHFLHCECSRWPRGGVTLTSGSRGGLERKCQTPVSLLGMPQLGTRTHLKQNKSDNVNRRVDNSYAAGVTDSLHRETRWREARPRLEFGSNL